MSFSLRRRRSTLILTANSIPLSVCLSVCQSVCLSVCLSIYLSIYLSVYLFLSVSSSSARTSCSLDLFFSVVLLTSSCSSFPSICLSFVVSKMKKQHPVTLAFLTLHDFSQPFQTNMKRASKKSTAS